MHVDRFRCNLRYSYVVHHIKCVANARTYANKTKLMAVRRETMRMENDKNLFAKIII